MAYTTIDDPSAHFQTVIWSGNGSNPRTISHDGNSDMKPDWTWHKVRSHAASHMLYDSTRGVGKRLHSDQTSAETTESAQGTITAFTSNGFTVDTGTSNDFYVNDSGKTYVAWNWKANGGTTSSNSNGSITSTVQANTTAGFSIVTWTGSGTSNETVGHGLTTAPEVVILKPRSESRHWLIWFDELGDNDKAFLFNNEAPADNRFGPNAPTSSVFGLYSNQGNRDGTTFVAYAFHSIKGYSKFGSYTGNGANDGPFVYTGFKPAWLMTKRTDGTSNWVMHDNTRDPLNESLSNNNGSNARKNLYANLTNTEDSSRGVNFYSNGFKIEAASSDVNNSGSTYIYMAFAEHPFVSSEGVPVTAR